MKRQMRKKRNRRASAGFSLAETLMAVLILLMVSAVVATGMPMARDAYEKAVDAANAHTLLSTTVTMLRGELSEAQYISGGGDTPILYRSARTGASTTLSYDESMGVKVKDYAEATAAVEHPLVTTQAATSRLRTEFGSISYANGVYTVTGLCVKRSGTVISKLDTLTINTVNP